MMARAASGQGRVRRRQRQPLLRGRPRRGPVLRARQLTSIPGWHFFTGPVPELRAVWRAYDIEVGPRGPGTDTIHTSALYFIDPHGTERYIASTMADYTKAGSAYLPAGQLASWGRGIALLARLLAG